MTIPFQASILAIAIRFILAETDKKAVIKEWADQIDVLSDKSLEKKSESIQLDVIEKVFFPLMKEMMADAPKEIKLKYLGIVATEFSELDRELRAES